MMYAPGHQTHAFAMKFQWASEELRRWFNDEPITFDGFRLVGRKHTGLYGKSYTLGR